MDDEINNLLLKHEKSNKQQAGLLPGNDDSDSDARLVNSFHCRTQKLYITKLFVICDVNVTTL